MEITAERFAELIVAEHCYNKLRRIIQEKVDRFEKLDYAELRILRDLCCHREEADGKE